MGSFNDVGGSAPLALALLAGLLVGAPPTQSLARPLSGTAPAAMVYAPPAQTAATLAELIDEVLADPSLTGATIGVSAFDLQTGKSLYTRGQDVPLNPASNTKLVTTAAALAILGPEHTYSTRVYQPHEGREGSAVNGNLYLKGSGDPFLVSSDLYELAAKLRAQGIARVGGVVVDSTAFDADELPPGFDQKDEMASYRAPSGATAVNFNTFLIRARPGAKAGEAVGASVQPNVDWLDLSNDATTAEGHRKKLWAEVEHKSDRVRLVLHGTLGVDAGPDSFRYPVGDPSRYAGEVMLMALQDAGIKVARKTPKLGEVPRNAELIEAHRSPALSILIRSVNKYSNNFMAEQLLKTLDDHAPATFAGALARVQAYMAEVGVDTEGLRLGNGSGLYDNNRISAAQMTKLLTAVYLDFRVSADFVASLAVMGADGTTKSRLSEGTAKGWVRVKTGTLDSISALSGYVGAMRRKPIVFSILLNDLPTSGTSKAREAQNKIAELLARHAAGLPLVPEVATP